MCTFRFTFNCADPKTNVIPSSAQHIRARKLTTRFHNQRHIYLYIYMIFVVSLYFYLFAHHRTTTICWWSFSTVYGWSACNNKQKHHTPNIQPHIPRASPQNFIAEWFEMVGGLGVDYTPVIIVLRYLCCRRILCLSGHVYRISRLSLYLTWSPVAHTYNQRETHMWHVAIFSYVCLFIAKRSFCFDETRFWDLFPDAAQ